MSKSSPSGLLQGLCRASPTVTSGDKGRVGQSVGPTSGRRVEFGRRIRVAHNVGTIGEQRAHDTRLGPVESHSNTRSLRLRKERFSVLVD